MVLTCGGLLLIVVLMLAWWFGLGAFYMWLCMPGFLRGLADLGFQNDTLWWCLFA